MPEFRQDPNSGRWVIIAEDRAGRPSEFVSQLPRRALSRCPFCAGYEQETPDAIAVYPGAFKSGGWQVRVIPNKYPAVTADGFRVRGSSPPERPGESITTNPAILVAQPGIGVHEVIIESPEHVTSFTELTDDQAHLSLRVYQDRLATLSQNAFLNYGLLFKNCRGGSGATLEHVHSQLLATNIVPTEVEQELRFATRHFDQTGQCLVCEILRQELGRQARIVTETFRFVAFCPFASRFPYETWILPRLHGNRFELLTDSAILTELAALLQLVLRSFEKLSANAAYNFWIHTAPFHTTCEKSFHWRIELVPRVTTQAGYEWGTGCFVNPVSPESAAQRLRQT